MNIHFLIHERFEAPGAAKDWAIHAGHNVTHTHLSSGDKLPNSIDNIDLLIVMGGPQNTATTSDECAHFDAQAEINLIRKMVDANKKVLGICLGAQLMSEAFGAKAGPSPEMEIGVYPVSLTEAGKNDPLLSHMGSTFDVAHWHEQMPGIPADAVVLAQSAGCPYQIVRFAPNAYGFQCHFEFSTDCVESLIEHAEDYLESQKNKPYVETAAVLVNHDFSQMNDLIKRFLEKYSK